MISHMPLDTVLTNPNAESARSTSLLSRFSSPLSKRARNAFDFSIEPKEPYKTYSPGDTVQGQVVLSILKGLDITHLTIALHGYAKVFKHQSDRRPTFEDLVNGQGTRGFEYLGSGLASLFQDEQVLCGSGFLKKQIYKFGFELQFPSKSLPSTIEFERGVIGYMISATVTRPTTIGPTSTKSVKIQFRDRVDIESLYTPKTRIISLEPINRKGKVKKVKTGSSISTLDASASSRRILTRNSTRTSVRSQPVASTTNPPLSPAPSEDTVATANTNTNSTHSMPITEHEFPPRKPSPETSETRSSVTSSSAHTITATVELPRHGAIPGDVVPIHVSVSHTKPHARGVVIATLYRTVRVDMHPVIPLSTKGKDKKKEYEDVYPRSRTGLGGLYYANSSPSSAFPKDLSQSSTMMIINPQTLTADINTSVKVPVEDALPTMTNIPGGMISFTYHIEIIIDLAGKLGESRLLPSLTNNGPVFTNGQDNGNQLSSDWAYNILDTTSLRRTKSVVTAILPLIVGTKDSRRDQRHMDLRRSNYEDYGYHGDYGWDENGYGPDGYDQNTYWNDSYYYDEYGNPITNGWYGYDGHHEQGLPQTYVSQPPDFQPEMDEKTRLRRQEELLMPSQPPELGESSNTARPLAPSAPTLADVGDAPDTPIVGSSSGSAVPMSISRASVRSGETIIPGTITPPPSLPDDEHMRHVTEDKQELERRRLMADASAPPMDDGGEGPSHVPSAPPAATAPMIDDPEEYIIQALRNERLGSEALPRYQR